MYLQLLIIYIFKFFKFFKFLIIYYDINWTKIWPLV